VLFGVGATERKWGFLLGGDWYARVDASYPLIFFRGPDFPFSEDFRFAFLPLGGGGSLTSWRIASSNFIGLGREVNFCGGTEAV
jgi:hypothetical protein